MDSNYNLEIIFVYKIKVSDKLTERHENKDKFCLE